MTDRDRLIELLKTPNKTAILRKTNPRFVTEETDEESIVADYLLANSVIVQEWIAVKDRLPEKDEDVWCYSNKDGGYRFVGYRGYISGEFMEGGCLHIGNVTHWMPLPKPPKEETEAEFKKRSEQNAK